MFGVGMPELVLMLMTMLLVFGASKQPATGAGFGKGIRYFKNAVSAFGDTDADPDSRSVF